MSSGRELWRRRVYGAQANVWYQFRALGTRQEFSLKSRDDRKKAVELFGRVMYRATLDVLTDETGTAYVSADHPMIARSHAKNLFRTCHLPKKRIVVNTKRNPKSAFFFATAAAGNKTQARFEVLPRFQGNTVSGYMGGSLQARVRQAVEYDHPWRSWNLYSGKLSIGFVLEEPFRAWFETDRRNTHMALQGALKDLPPDIKRIIVRAVRDSHFHALMDAAGVPEA